MDIFQLCGGLDMATSAAMKEAYRELLAEQETGLAKLEQEIAIKQMLIAELQRKLDGMPNGQPVETPPDNSLGSGRRAGSISKGSVTDHIVALLRETGKPMRAAEIASALESRGVTTTSPKGLLPGVLSTLTRRKNTFEKVERGVYKLNEAEMPET